MARICWGTRCKGFCSKEGSHYQIEQRQGADWNTISCKEHLGSCPEAVVRQATINLDSLFWKSFGDSLPELYCVDLAKAYVTQENVSWRNFAWEEKVWFVIAQQTFAWETFSKRQNRERKPLPILVPGSHERLASRKRVMCARDMGVHVRRGTRRTKCIKNGMRNWISAQARKVQRN